MCKYFSSRNKFRHRNVFVLLFGLRALWLSPLVILVGWARWQVRAHTLLQALAGTALAVSVTILGFRLFGIL